MFGLFGKSKRKKEIKSTFKEYGYEIQKFTLTEFGEIDFANWLHPFNRPIIIEDSNVNFYKSLSSQGGLIIDIGTYTGDTTVPMALAVGKDGLVIGLEPNPYAFKILEANAGLNTELTNIEPLPFAATQEDGEFVFNYSDASFCNGGFLSQIENQNHKHSYELKVEGKNFDKYLRAHYVEWLPKLDLLKVDAEGFDKDILINMAGIISEFRPAIMAECYKKLTIDERHALYDAMACHDYTVYMNDIDFFKEGFIDGAKMVKLTRETMTIKKHFEIVAIPN